MLSHTATTQPFGIDATESHTGNGGKNNRSWGCSLRETRIGEYIVVPLNSTRMLKSESYWMNNCCRDYAEHCAQRNYTIFSVRRRTGERLATLGLANTDESWQFDQCYGPSNSEVLEEVFEYFDDDGIAQTEYYPTELYYIAHEVVRLMNSQGTVQ